MNPRAENWTTWENLARDLGGSFSARARGMVAPELVLLTRDGEPFGFLAADETGGTRLQAGGLTARIEPRAVASYAMTTSDEETLTAEASGSATTLALRSGGRSYEARISLLRNTAVARSPGGREAASVSGGLTNRRYGVVFDPQDPVSLPLSIFLLGRTFALRSRAYRAGA